MENKTKMPLKVNIIPKSSNIIPKGFSIIQESLNVILNLFQNLHSFYKLILLIFSFSLFSINAFAQATSELVAEKTEEIVWQILEWEEENSSVVLRYDIQIEKYNAKKDSYFPLLLLKTEDNRTSIKIEHQLESGIYRYKIISYDLLGFGTVESAWFDLVIYKAYEPEIKSISSNVNYSSTIYLEEYNDGVFNISGKNLFNIPTTGKEVSFTNYYLKKKNKNTFEVLIPIVVEVSSNNRNLVIKIDPEKMDTGVYHLIAKDASGLENEINSDCEFTIKYKKMMDFNISLGYSVPCILYDDTFNKYMNKKIWPISFTPKATFIPIKRRWGFLGLGLSGNWTRMSTNFDTYKITGNVISGFANFVYQKPFYKQVSESQRKHVMTFETYIGTGIVSFYDYAFTFSNGSKSEAYNKSNFGFDAGIAFQYFWTSRVYTELEIKYINAFTNGMTFGMVIPTISVGWQF